jgi:hypothetical protein
MPRRELHVGRVSLLLDGADLRYVVVDGVEVARRLYVTVRDTSWGTPPITALETAVREEAETIVVSARGEQGAGEVRVLWEATATIQAEGAVSYRVAASPQGEFAFNRMGLCVLHPPSTCAGRPYRAFSGEAKAEGILPDAIAPENLSSFAALEIDVRGLGRCRFAFEGDLFELEDQRNWSDGSFKTYCTPLANPLPQRARSGEIIEQLATLTVPRAPHPVSFPSLPTPDAVEVEVGSSRATALPELGLCAGTPLDGTTASTIRALAPAHLRFDLRDPTRWDAALAQAAADADAAGCPLVLALHLGEPADEELSHLAARLGDLSLPVVRIMAFSRVVPVSVGPLVRQARDQLAPLFPAASFVGGTDVWFAEVNHARPQRRAMDGLAWSINPTVHGDDELTMVEALEGQTDQVATARSFADEMDLLPGPISLRPRYNPNAPDAATQARDYPPASIDPRQGSAFAAAWTAASVRALAVGGVQAATYFETSGPRGVLSPDGTKPFPCGRVLGWACARAGWEVLDTTSSAPLRAQALMASAPTSDEVEGLLVNLTAAKQRVRLTGLATLSAGSHATLDSSNGALETELGPWEVAQVCGRLNAWW